jgi:hypothetical protein
MKNSIFTNNSRLQLFQWQPKKQAQCRSIFDAENSHDRTAALVGKAADEPTREDLPSSGHGTNGAPGRANQPKIGCSLQTNRIVVSQIAFKRNALGPRSVSRQVSGLSIGVEGRLAIDRS